MNDPVPMNCPNTLDNLFSKVPNLGLGQEFAFSHQPGQVPWQTEFLAKIHPVRVVNHAKVLEHIAVATEFFQMCDLLLDLFIG
jgi:hypothetical protein